MYKAPSTVIREILKGPAKDGPSNDLPSDSNETPDKLEMKDVGKVKKKTEVDTKPTTDQQGSNSLLMGEGRGEATIEYQTNAGTWIPVRKTDNNPNNILLAFKSVAKAYNHNRIRAVDDKGGLIDMYVTEDKINELSRSKLNDYADGAFKDTNARFAKGAKEGWDKKSVHKFNDRLRWFNKASDKAAKKLPPSMAREDVNEKFDPETGANSMTDKDYKDWEKKVKEDKKKAKKKVNEGTSASHLSKNTVTCPVCEGKKKPCKRCGGTGKLEGNVKLSLDKQNTGVHARRAWIKEQILAELSKKTYANYIPVAAADLGAKSHEMATTRHDKHKGAKWNDLVNQYVNRKRGIKRASNKLAEEKINEISRNSLTNYHVKAMYDNKDGRRNMGIRNAIDRLKGVAQMKTTEKNKHTFRAGQKKVGVSNLHKYKTA